MLINNKDLIFIIIISILLVFNIYQYYISKKNSSIEILKNKKNELFLKDNIFTIDAKKTSKNTILSLYMSCLVGCIPLKIKNGIDIFPIIKSNWNEEYLKKKYSTEKKTYEIVSSPVSMEDYDKNYIDSYFKKFNIKNKEDDFNSAINNVKNDFIIDATPNLYLDSNYTKYTKNNPNNYVFRREKPSPKIASRISDDILPNMLFGNNNIDSFIIYNAPKNTGVLPHAHGDSINILKNGKKKWIFCNGDTITIKNEKILLSDKARYDCKQKNNKINWMNWYDNYRNLQKTSQIECLQESGDIILVPRKISHSVYNIENSLGTVIDLIP